VRCSIEILRSADKFLEKLSKQRPSDADVIEDAIGDLLGKWRPDVMESLGVV